METKHTKGEWGLSKGAFNWTIVSLDSGFPIATVENKFRKHELNEANAKLLVASKKLLTALEPFERLANEVFKHRYPEQNGVLYQFTNASITFEDLRNVLAAIRAATE